MKPARKLSHGVRRFATLAAHPVQDQLPAEEVVPDLFGREPFRLQHFGQRRVPAVPRRQRTGDFEPVTHLSLDRQR